MLKRESKRECVHLCMGLGKRERERERVRVGGRERERDDSIQRKRKRRNKNAPTSCSVKSGASLSNKKSGLLPNCFYLKNYGSR